MASPVSRLPMFARSGAAEETPPSTFLPTRSLYVHTLLDRFCPQKLWIFLLDGEGKIIHSVLWTLPASMWSNDGSISLSQVHFHAVHRRKGRPSILSVLNILRILLFKYIFVRKKIQTRTYRTFERIWKLTSILLLYHLLSNSDCGWIPGGCALVHTLTSLWFGRPRRKKERRVDTMIDEMTLLTKGASFSGVKSPFWHTIRLFKLWGPLGARMRSRIS